jgi:hypothetical protein
MRLVVDTQLLVAAIRARESQGDPSVPTQSGDEPALNLVNRIIEVCPEIVFTGDLADEAQPHIRRAGIRFPVQVGNLLRELEEQHKLVRPRASAIKKLNEDELKLLKDRGHRDVRDDRPVVEAARTMQAPLITEDPHLQKKGPVFKKKLGFEVYSVDEVKRE